MGLQNIFMAEVTNTNSAVLTPQNPNSFEYGLVACQITGTATVIIQGKTPNMTSWVNIFTFTSTGAQKVVLMPQMRGVTTGNTGSVIMDLID